MRLLKYVIAAVLLVLALTAGIVVTVVFATCFLAVVLVRWAKHRFGQSRGAAVPSPAARRPTATGDVIDVSATEVPAPATAELPAATPAADDRRQV
ncbi:hypothetical protein [Opitutus sp. ER46]|uniref:hypothetical protein n=1 Tax=Opitutus sp. ER46 TaxID=2161864 RepID=UPI0011B20D14|nr:hypothetical protein [Opitutus sp. ER46]